MARADQITRAAVPGFVEKLGAFYDRAERFTPLLGTLAGKGLFVVRTEDKHIGRSLFAKGGRGEISVLARAVNLLKALYDDDVVHGATFIDVGANIGTTTIPALLEQGFGRAVAIEPEHDNYVTLRANAVLNEVDDRVIALQAAASNVTGKSELVVNRSQGGKHWIATDDEKLAKAGTATEVVEVETVTLDNLAENGTIELERTGLLWMDAQGHEGHIIQGASKFTDRGVPIVLEWDPKGLDEVGDRSKVERIAAESYTHFGNMRADSSSAAPKYWLQDINALNAYANRFLGPDRRQVFTDILLVRLEEQDVPDSRSGDYIDMSHVMRGQSLLNRLAAEEEDDAPRHQSADDRNERRARHRHLEAKRLNAEKKRARAEERRKRRGAPAAKVAKPAPKSDKSPTKGKEAAPENGAAAIESGKATTDAPEQSTHKAGSARTRRSTQPTADEQSTPSSGEVSRRGTRRASASPASGRSSRPSGKQSGTQRSSGAPAAKRSSRGRSGDGARKPASKKKPGDSSS